jgi:hypothetical protein
MSTIDRASIDRGYGFPLEFELQKADGSPEVVSGTVATWKLGASAESAVLITKVGLVPSTVRGKTVVALELSAEETGGLAPGQYYHQLAVTLSAGQPRIYARGWLTVKDRL